MCSVIAYCIWHLDVCKVVIAIRFRLRSLASIPKMTTENALGRRCARSFRLIGAHLLRASVSRCPCHSWNTRIGRRAGVLVKIDTDVMRRLLKVRLHFELARIALRTSLTGHPTHSMMRERKHCGIAATKPSRSPSLKKRIRIRRSTSPV